MKKNTPPIWRDGKLVKWEDAKVHVFSHALSRGSAVFEVLTAERTDFGTALFRPVEHIGRMSQSARAIGLKVPYKQSEQLDAMKQVVRASGLDAAIIKVVALWHRIEFEVIPHHKEVSMFISALPLPDPFSKKAKGARDRTRGYKARTVSVRKLDPSTVPVTAKVAANYINPMLAKMEAKKHGADIPIMLDTKGYIAEGATESIFMVRKGKLLTPAEGNILHGITRDSVIRLAGDLGIPVEEKRLKPNTLDTADEIFFTGTSEWIVSVSVLNGKRVGNGKPGPVTKMLLDHFEEVVRGRVSRYKKWFVPI